MNKAFKVLWNDARRTFVVSSETKMSRGKSTKASKKMLVISLAGILACTLGGGKLFAADLESTFDINNDNLAQIGTTKIPFW